MRYNLYFNGLNAGLVIVASASIRSNVLRFRDDLLDRVIE